MDDHRYQLLMDKLLSMETKMNVILIVLIGISICVSVSGIAALLK